MKKVVYHISKEPQRGFKVGDKVAYYIQANKEYLTGVLRHFEIFSDNIYAVFGNYRAEVKGLQRYLPYMDSRSTPNAVQLSINF